MKKLIISFAISLVSTISFSQVSEFPKPLKQTKVTTLEALLISCDRFENMSIFLFNDAKYNQIPVPITFKLTDAEFEEVYSALSERFSKDSYNDDEGFIMTTEDKVKIIFKFTKSMGVKSVRFSVERNGIISLGYYLNQKQVKKLFDKAS